MHVTQGTPGRVSTGSEYKFRFRPDIPDVQRLRTAAMFSTEENGVRIGALGDGHQADVVRHYTINEHSDACFVETLAKQSKVQAPICGAREDFLVIGPAWVT